MSIKSLNFKHSKQPKHFNDTKQSNAQKDETTHLPNNSKSSPQIHEKSNTKTTPKSRVYILSLCILLGYIFCGVVAMILGDSDEVWGIGRLCASIFDIGAGIDFGSFFATSGNENASVFDSSLLTSDSRILWEVRLPRILMAILVGALLASSGAVTQSIFANPIADPYIIGIASAATFGAVLAHFIGLDDVYYGVVGFVCCAGFSLVIFALQKRANITMLLIIGIAISSFLGALSSLFMYIIGESSFKIVTWLMGYLGLSAWYKVGILSAVLVGTLGYFYAHRNGLNIILSGDEEAKNLGVDAPKLKRNLLIASSVAVSFGVAFCGLIGFVGLIIPHIIRLGLKDYNNALVLPLCTALGGLFLLFCDSIARSVQSFEIPIGIITAFFGAPVFLYLALKSRRF